MKLVVKAKPKVDIAETTSHFHCKFVSLEKVDNKKLENIPPKLDHKELSNNLINFK